MTMYHKHFISEVIKEFQTDTVPVVCVRGSCFSHSLEFIDRLFAEALKDFPWLKREDVTVAVHKESVRFGSLALHIDWSSRKDIQVPDSYRRIPELPDYF